MYRNKKRKKNEFKQRDALYYIKERQKTALAGGIIGLAIIIIFYLLNLIFEFVEI